MFIADSEEMAKLLESLVSNLLRFLKQEKIRMGLREISNLEFWFEGPYGFLTVKFFIDEDAHEVLYGCFLAEI